MIKNKLSPYFRDYDRSVWLKIRDKRYKQIVDNDFYLDKDTEIFKNEVLKFWTGNYIFKGYNYQNSEIQKNNGEWILFQDGNGEIIRSEEILKELEKDNLKLHGNYSWSKLFMGGDITSDIKKLKETLNYLFDENIDIEKRFFEVVDINGSHKIEGMSNGKASSFLHIKYPKKYGVWNSCTSGAFKILSRFDKEFKITESSVGKKYKKINEILNSLFQEYNKENIEGGFENLSDVDIFVWYVVNNQK